MTVNVAMERYLERHIESELPSAPADAIESIGGRWRNVLVIPCYDESSDLISNLSKLADRNATLVILVLNRPDASSDCTVNSSLRAAIGKLEIAIQDAPKHITIYRLTSSTELYCYDLEQLKGPSVEAQGVGVARKTGCDIALLWQNQGAISGNWICSTDADATLPTDYFSRLEKCEKTSGAAVFPFLHKPGDSEATNAATVLYELKLHHYALGLLYAKSPYAYHTLGSCIAVKADQYAQVRGYPKRSAGEDFYLLNKLAKVAPVTSLTGECIVLESRVSHRVPFGTGPATQKIVRDGLAAKTPLFYHPQSYEALRAILAVVDDLQITPLDKLPLLLMREVTCESLRQSIEIALKKLGLEAALVHCRKQGRSSEQFHRQFHQWFDGFRTLKFIHEIRAQGWQMQSLKNLSSLTPRLFPNTQHSSHDHIHLRDGILEQWNWANSSRANDIQN